MIESVTISAGVRVIGREAFSYCRKLRQVAFVEDSQLEKIEEGCFTESGLKEIVLPRKLKKIDENAFGGCHNLKTVWIEDGFALDLANVVDSSAKILPSKQTLVGDQRLWDIR